MPSLELTTDFNISREKLLQLAADVLKSGETLDISIPIMGELFFTDSEELASEFLYAAYIGESIADACTSFTCEADYDSVTLHVMPADAKAFVSSLWEAITGFLSEDLLAEEGLDDVSAAESRYSGEDFIDNPELVRYTQEVVELAWETIAMSEDEDEDEDEDDEEEGEQQAARR